MSQAGKGHVPEENLPRYRALAQIARQYKTLSNNLNNLGEYFDGHNAQVDSKYYWDRANELRVNLPEKVSSGLG